MSHNPTLKRLWWMIAATATLIILLVYVGLVPAAQGQSVSLSTLEKCLFKDSLVPSAALSQSAVSGGMSRGGSFSRPAAPAPALPRSAPAPSYNYGYRSAPGPVIVPYPTYAPAPVYVGPSAGGGSDSLFFGVIVLGFILLPIAFNYLQAGASGRPGPGTAGRESELLNDIVTVTQVQVALLAGARALQRDLTQLTLKADLSTSAGLAAQLQGCIREAMHRFSVKRLCLGR
jgi:uncharacterized membrane protein